MFKFIENLIIKWSYKKDPSVYISEDYEILIRMARLCAYDLEHVIQDLPRTSFLITTFDIEDRARRRSRLFAGNPGKDYKIKLATNLDNANEKLDSIYEYCEENGIQLPDNLKDTRIPF